MNTLFLNSLPHSLPAKSSMTASWVTQSLWLKKMSSEGNVISLSVRKCPLAFFFIPLILLFKKIDRIVVYNLMKRAPLPLVNLVASFFKVPVTAIVFDISDNLQVKMAKSLPRVQKRIFITKAIADDFAPGIPCEIEDGSGLRDCFNNRRSPTIQFNNDRFVIVYAGALQPYNCIETILAFMRFCHDPDVELILAGAADDLRIFAKIKESAAIDPRIKYLGIISSEDIKQLYESASVLLCLRDDSYPLMRYHFPSKIFELMETGKPIIASNTGHLKERYGDLIHVIDKIDTQSLVDAVMAVRYNNCNKKC